MPKNLKFLIIFGCFLFVVYLVTYVTNNQSHNIRYLHDLDFNSWYSLIINSSKIDSDDRCEKYHRECLSLYNKLLYPNLSLIFRPPPSQPPAELLNDFTQNGKMPIRKYWYFDDAYSNSSSNKEKNDIERIKNDEIDVFRNRIRNGSKLNYDDENIKLAMFELKEGIKNKNLVVVGTRKVWIEALGLEAGVSKITTLDYTHKEYEDKKKLEWIHVNDYLKNAIDNKILEKFDNAASFSSIEHSGLGRYGDPLSPYGDIEAIKQIHCMLKPDGLLFLGIPISFDGSSYIEFNAQRIYGDSRLKLLFEGWTQVKNKYKDKNKSNHTVFILRKIKSVKKISRISNAYL